MKENVVAQEARGTVNFRILPCETTDDVLAHVRKTIDDDNIEIEHGDWGEAAKPGRVDTRAWNLLAAATTSAYPDALVLPGQLSGATDTRHYRALADDIYRFLGFRTSTKDIGGFHGTDERLAIDSYTTGIALTTDILRRAGSE